MPAPSRVRVTGRTEFLQNRLMPGLALAALTFFGALFLIDPRLYLRVLGLWSFVLTGRVFLDVEYVTAQIACWGQGIDVYSVNPCDPLGRVHDYSPLWLRMGFLPAGYGWAKLLGVAQDLAFVGALGFLPAVRGRAACALMVAGVLSPTVLFGMERGNVDLGMVVLAVAGLALLERGGAPRAAGYAVFLLAGLLKFYPLVLFARALEERPRVFFAVAAAASLGVAALVVSYGHELRLAIGNVPLPSDFGDGFAARQFGDGMGFLLHLKGLGGPLTLALAGVAAGLAWRMAAREAFALAFAALSDRARACLVAGALLFCGCFLTGPSVGYRGVVLVLALPGLVLMAQAAEGAMRRKLWHRAAIMVLAMWNFVPMMALGPKAPLGKALGPMPFLTVWACREALWWVVLVVLLAVVFRFSLESEVRKNFFSEEKKQKTFVILASE